MDITQTITHVSLCAGYGGIDLGLGRAIPNLRTVAFSEIEAFACANLVSKMEAGLLDAAPIWTDLKTFPWAEFRDKVDILSGGYPCQPFSAAGKRLGTEDPRHLWPFIADGIRAMRPRICFFENVEGHISLGLREVISELESIGYQTTFGIFSAREVGAPHQRKRVFILAHRHGERGQLPNWWREPAEQVPVGYGETRGDDQWPSRPGEPQHGWEPPRVVANSESKRAGQRSEFCSEECGSGSALSRDVEQSGEPMGDSEGGQDHGREPRDLGVAPSQGRCGDHAADCTSEGMGNTILHGHAPSEISGGPSQSKTEGGMQEPEGGSSSMGNSEHDGLFAESIIRGDEATSNERAKEESNQARQSSGTDRPTDVPSLQGSSGRSESVGYASEQRCEGSRGKDDSGWAVCRSSEPDGSSFNRSMESEQWQTQPPLGRDADGITNRLDDAELYTTCDNRTDELRLLGNGVVPSTAERAFLTLMDELLSENL